MKNVQHLYRLFLLSCIVLSSAETAQENVREFSSIKGPTSIAAFVIASLVSSTINNEQGEGSLNINKERLGILSLSELTNLVKNMYKKEKKGHYETQIKLNKTHLNELTNQRDELREEIERLQRQSIEFEQKKLEKFDERNQVFLENTSQLDKYDRMNPNPPQGNPFNSDIHEKKEKLEKLQSIISEQLKINFEYIELNNEQTELEKKYTNLNRKQTDLNMQHELFFLGQGEHLLD